MPSDKSDNLYTETIISRKVRLPYTAVGKNLENNLKIMISHMMEGKCSKEGYIQVGTMKILTYSVGLQIANDVEFEVVISCYVCCPVEDMYFNCVVKNKTGAGIRAEVTYEQELSHQVALWSRNDPGANTENITKNIESKMGSKSEYNSPIVVYLAAEHNDTKLMENCDPGNEISIKVRGQRYELNDRHVNIIGQLVSIKNKSNE